MWLAIQNDKWGLWIGKQRESGVACGVAEETDYGVGWLYRETVTTGKRNILFMLLSPLPSLPFIYFLFQLIILS
ncbi:hypothetical protein P3X46_017276 [Hevea brasiliensis]|uniref:Uncharacterized protein n=1 Tax=Hevea brasiliensis TaxID=3981 RepID=A0ABQ9M1R5_HEVBR|nr:hypothetical protein P3X46_017276 [Hevea brasiliensis]